MAQRTGLSSVHKLAHNFQTMMAVVAVAGIKNSAMQKMRQQHATKKTGASMRLVNAVEQPRHQQRRQSEAVEPAEEQLVAAQY